MKSPHDPDVLRLLPWRDANRPLLCQHRHGKPCWVYDPYAAVAEARYCWTCGSRIPEFDAVKFREFCLSLKDPVI